MIPTDRIRYFFLINGMLLGNICANYIGEFSINIFFSFPRMDAPEELTRWFYFLSEIYGTIGLVCIILFTLWYERPIRKCMKLFRDGNRPGPKILDTARRRLLNEPYMVVIMNILLWGCGSVFFLFSNTPKGMSLGVASGLFTIVIAFFFVEHISHQYLIPVFFPDGGLSKIKRVQTISLKIRLYTLIFSVSIVPLSLIHLTIHHFKQIPIVGEIEAITLMGRIQNIIATESTVFLIMGIIMAVMFGRNLKKPVDEISRAIEQIRKGDLNTKAVVYSTDEIGYVGEALNEMTRGLKERERLKKSNIALEKAKQSIEKYSKALNDELERGKKIQNDFLPHSLPEVENCNVMRCFQPALKLSGDFYDLFELTDRHLCFVVADVSGKGVGSALFMALTRSLLRVFSASIAGQKKHEDGDPGGFSPEDALNVVRSTNEYLAREHGEEGMFVTLFFAVIDRIDGCVHYVNGGNEPAMIIGNSGLKELLYPTGPALGPIQDAEYKIKTIRLAPGDMLFGFTDGITEARSATRDFYTRDRLVDTINKGINGSSAACWEAVKTDLFTFIKNAPQSDDITMLAVQWTPGEQVQNKQ